MFLTLELAAVLVETTLGYAARTYRKPCMIRLVILVEPLTVLRVGLSEPTVVIMPLNLLDVRSPLTLHIFAHKLLEWTVILENLLLTRLLLRAHRKEFKSFHVRFLGKRCAVQVSPWNIRVTCGFLVGPQHSQSRTSINRRVDNTVPVKRKVLGQIQNYF